MPKPPSTMPPTSTSTSTSTTTPKPSPAPLQPPSAPRLLIPKSQSPNYHTTPLSILYRHTYPIVLLSILYLFFPALVSDPITTLWVTAPGVAVLQMGYCGICLPAWTGDSAGGKKKERGEKDKGEKGENGGRKEKKRVQFAKPPSTTLVAKIKPALLSLLLSLALSPPLTLLLILHGASMTTNHMGTFLLALHMVLLTCPPLVYVHGVDRRMWREILTLSLPMDEMFGGVVGCLVGTLLGQVALPLDWDREWQRWPVPLVVGAYAGWMVGRMVGEWVLKGWRIDFNNGGEGGKLDGE